MNNMYDSPAGAGSGDLGSLGDAGDPAGSYGSHGGFPSARTRKKRMFRWGAGITLAGFLAGGLIALALSGSSAPAASPASTVSGSGQVQGTALNSALSTASSTTAVPLGRIRWALARLRALGGVHGEFTFYNKTGFHTLAFERGTIQSVNGTDVVISAPDGTVWTWLIVSNTVVRESGSKTTTNALATGELVFAGGPVVNGARDARLIVIRPDGSGSSGSGSSSSGSGSGSSSSVAGPGGTSVS
ncbi:MAG TPA: hypothetical protein VEF71_17790 [Streptosporangiaceae bacterium]|nr:hypothetical protein [Streptosporangiaceae bacterium]